MSAEIRLYRKKQKNTLDPLTKASIEARKLGLSYGQYQAMRYNNKISRKPLLSDAEKTIDNHI